MSSIPGIPDIPAPANCCFGAPTPPLPPLQISNPPGLSAIQYRIGTFTTFRQAMLNSVALPGLMAGAITALVLPVSLTGSTITVLDSSQFPLNLPFQIKIGTEYMQITGNAGGGTWMVTRGSTPTAHAVGDMVTVVPLNPFAAWRPGINGDYQRMLIEAWAYLADVLTFYQERVANEAFIGTATQRESLLRLASLIDYHPSPGAAASGLVAFTIAANQSLTIPAGFRVGSAAQSGQPPVVFETTAAAFASSNNNQIALATVSLQVQFPANTLVFQGTNTLLGPGDYILAVEGLGTSQESASLLQIATVNVDPIAHTTTVTWQGGAYTQATKQVSVYALRVSAPLFGSTAPRWDALAPALTNSDGQHSNITVPYPASWDVPFAAVGSAIPSFLPPNPLYYLPLQDDVLRGQSNVVYLDGIHSQLKYTTQSPGWAVLLADGGSQILHVVDARPWVKTAFSVSGRCTRLTFKEPVNALNFPVRTSVVLTGSQPLAVQNELPLGDRVQGDTLTLDGLHSELQDGQTVQFQGVLFDPVAQQPSDLFATETSVLDGPPAPDANNNITVIRLKAPLASQYVRSTSSILANIAVITQGQTVKDEILGSSNGSAFQSYPLKQRPLTYLPSTDPESLSSVQSTLTVAVNGEAWNEQPNLVSSGPHAQDFTTSLDDSGQTTVIFGDGVNGARPPRGTKNIHARYRKGLGSSGNLSADSIRQLVDSLPNLQKVTNPEPSNGGADEQAIADIRRLAPASLQTFGRAVSVADYASLALTFPGIAKAAAAWIFTDPVTSQALAHPYVQLTVAAANRVPIQGTVLAGKLRRFLDNRRDPNVSLRIQDFNPIFIDVAVDVEIDPHFPHQGTLNQVQAALNPGINPDGNTGYFAFQSLQLGQSIYLSALYTVVQTVPGVKDANIISLRRLGPVLADPVLSAPHDILVGPTEIISMDNSGTSPSQLTVTGQGGFLDT